MILSGRGRTIVDGIEGTVQDGDIIRMQAGCKHTIIADTDLRVIEIQLGKDISVEDKEKFDLEYQNFNKNKTLRTYYYTAANRRAEVV